MGFVDATAGGSENRVVLTHWKWDYHTSNPTDATQRRALDADGHKVGYLTETERNIAANRTNLLGSQTDRLMIRIENTGATEPDTVTVKILAGPDQNTSSLGLRSGLGNLEYIVPNSTTEWFGPFEASRFVQADGCVHVDITLNASGDGYITAFLLPKPQNEPQTT